jgi:predicted dehydrogenase
LHLRHFHALIWIAAYSHHEQINQERFQMIRLGIIGTGGMAHAHAHAHAHAQAQAFAAIKGCKVVTCCGIIPGRAKAFAEKYGIPTAYQNTREMFRKEDLDGVSIVTIDRAHAPAALLTIEYRVNVMCEKPLADSLKDALRVYGDKGAPDLNLDRPPPDTLRVCLGKDADATLWMPVKYPPTPSMYQRFVASLKTGRQGQTSFADWARVQAYLDASAISAKRGGRFITL